MLPAISSDAQDETAPASRRTTPAPRARVLLVDDEPTVRALCARILRAAGFDVVAASDGLDALRRLADAGPFDVLVSDVAMPRLGGPELARLAHERAPGLRVLLMSGYVEGGAATLGPHRFLAKPFAPAELKRVVRELAEEG